MTLSRKTVREKIASDLTTKLGSLVQQVFDHMKGNFDGQSPIVRVMSNGSNRPRLTARTGKTELYFIIQIWVILSDKAMGWTEKKAEDAIDEIEKEISNWLFDNRQNSVWKSLEYTGPSRIDTATFEGKAYVIEDIQISVEAF